MIEVFKTNINDERTAKQIVKTISWKFPDVLINFDLEDHDRILRIESRQKALPVQDIIMLLESGGHACEVLED